MALGDEGDPVPIKQNDTRPKIRGAIWQGSAQTPISLTGATVVFNMRSADPPGTVVVNRQSATVLDAPAGLVEYTLKASETVANGLYTAEFEATLGDGGILTVPPGPRYIWVQISDDIG